MSSEDSIAVMANLCLFLKDDKFALKVKGALK